jgi:hypothetical protein
MTNFRALCAELFLFAEQAGEICHNEGLWPDCDQQPICVDGKPLWLLDRVRAALAEPEPEGPTDLQPIPLGILADVFSNTERPDKISVTLAKTTRDLIVEYRDLDDEWFKELSAALTEPETDIPGIRGTTYALYNAITQSALDEVHYEWELEDDEGKWQADGSANSLEDAQRDGMRYLQIYTQEGFHRLIIRRHCAKVIQEINND